MRPRPTILSGNTIKTPTGCGRNLYITVNQNEGVSFETFIKVGKCGGCIMAWSEGLSRLISLCLRSEIGVDEIIRQLAGVRCPAPILGRSLSCVDTLAKVLDQERGGETVIPVIPDDMGESHMPESPVIQETPAIIIKQEAAMGGAPECPDCHNIIEFVEGCKVCKYCGWSECG